MMNPSIYNLYFLFGYWGITTILFFWAALIKATRSIAGNNQGVSFGALEAGRGLVAAFCASIAVFLYSNNSLLEFLTNIISKNLSPLSIVIFFYSCVTFLSSIIILIFKEEVKQAKANKTKYNIREIYKNKKPILCISIIVFSAYTCYKAIDFYFLYFFEILEFSKEKSAYVMAIFSYTRPPIAALLAGLIADKITSRSCTKFIYSFFMLVAYTSLGIFNFR